MFFEVYHNPRKMFPGIETGITISENTCTAAAGTCEIRIISPKVRIVWIAIFKTLEIDFNIGGKIGANLIAPFLFIQLSG